MFQGFSHTSGFKHHFEMAKLATSSIRVKHSQKSSFKSDLKSTTFDYYTIVSISQNNIYLSLRIDIIVCLYSYLYCICILLVLYLYLLCSIVLILHLSE